MHRLLINDNRNTLPENITFHPLRLTFDAKNALAQAPRKQIFPLSLIYGENEHTLKLGDKTFTLTVRTNEPSNREVLYSKSDSVPGQLKLKGRIGARMVIKPELTESSREHIRNVALECERAKKSRSVIVAGPDGKFQSAPPLPKPIEPEKRNNRLFVHGEPPPKPGKPNLQRRTLNAAVLASSVPERINPTPQSGPAAQTSKPKEANSRKTATKSQTRKPTKSKQRTETVPRQGLRERVSDFIAIEIKSSEDILEHAERVYPGIAFSEIEPVLKEVACVRKGSWLLKPREYTNLRIWDNDSFDEDTKRIVARKAESSFRKLKIPADAEEWKRIIDPTTNQLPSMTKKRKPSLANETGAAKKKGKSQVGTICEETFVAPSANTEVVRRSSVRRSASNTSDVATRGSTVQSSALVGKADGLKAPMGTKLDGPAAPTKRRKNGTSAHDLNQTATLVSNGQSESSKTCAVKKPNEVVASRQRADLTERTEPRIERRSSEVSMFMPRHRTVRPHGAALHQGSDGTPTEARTTGQDSPAIGLVSSTVPTSLSLAKGTGPTKRSRVVSTHLPDNATLSTSGTSRTDLTEEERQRMGRLKRLLADAREQLRPWYSEYDRLVREMDAGTLKEERRLEKVFEEIGGERVIRWKRELRALVAKASHDRSGE